MHLSQGRPQIELQVVSYDGGRAKVVFVLSEREESHGHELTDLVHTGTYGNLQRPMHTTNTAHMAPHVPIIHEMDKKGNLKLLQVGTIDWVGGHVPNDQPWGDPDLPQLAVVFAALGAFIFVLIVAFLLIHRWIKANTVLRTPDGEAMDDASKVPTTTGSSNNTYRSTSPSHVRYTLLSPKDLAHPELAHLRID